ncbi:MAG: alpha/beta fold hydrolase [Xanthomonadaceae bacterium]|nr:alpha/beta fold hydrolase [Xanthomonadaceae bacterium]
MITTLVSIPTPTTPLDGLWYVPAAGTPRGAVLLFHGNTMNFYTGMPRFLPPALVAMGYACLAFNRRGHDILAIRDSRAAEGAAFQTIAEAREDNALAARWVAAQGFADPIVIGHSNGGMLAVRHVADHPGTPALVLLSAHCGGREISSRMARAGLLAGDRLDEINALARQRVAEGRGAELLQVPGWWYVVSAASYVDWLDNVPDVLALAPQIACPVLYLCGDEEPPETYPAEQFSRRAGGPCTVNIVPQCNHFYAGREDAVTQRVVNWLAGLAPMH